jgi:thiol:disulfide interchange protein
MAMKFEYLDIDYKTQEQETYFKVQDIKALQNEVTADTDWTLFDDANVESMGDW